MTTTTVRELADRLEGTLNSADQYRARDIEHFNEAFADAAMVGYLRSAIRTLAGELRGGQWNA